MTAASTRTMGASLVRADRSASRRSRDVPARGHSPRTARQRPNEEAPHGAVSIQEAAVLFADTVGFTRISEDLESARVIGFLRQFHMRMASMVYRHGGRANDYVGDAIMAVFSTPHHQRHEAANALACAFDMIEAIDAWNAKLEIARCFPIRIGVGIHFGVVVMGLSGARRHQEHAVVGDTVNVARKLGSLTRQLNASIVISEDVARAAAHRPCDDYVVAGMTAYGMRRLPGRQKSISMLGIDRNSIHCSGIARGNLRAAKTHAEWSPQVTPSRA